MADTKERSPIAPETLNKIAGYITSIRGLGNFVQCSKLTYKMAEPLHWEMDTQRRNGKPALYQAIEDNNHVAITKALDWYARLGATGFLDGMGVKYQTFWWDDGRHALKDIRSPVMLAVQVGTVDTLRLVVNHPAGCNVNMRRPSEFNRRVSHLGSCPLWPPGDTPCSCWLHKECVYYLCTAWRDREKSYMSCETALHMAIRAHSTAKLRILLEAGAELPSSEEMLSFYNNLYKTANLEDIVAESFRGSFAEGGVVHEDMMNIVKMYNERRSSTGAIATEP